MRAVLKRILIAMLFIGWCSTEMIAQESKTTFIKNGYIGITLGAASPLGDFGDDAIDNDKAGYAESGLNITLISFGYEFVPNFGFAVSWFGGAHIVETDFLEGIQSYGALLVGPMGVYHIDEKTALDVKLLIGQSVGINDLSGDSIQGNGFGLNFGLTLRADFSKRFGAMVHTDFFTTTIDYDTYDQPIQAVNLNGGLYVKF